MASVHDSEFDATRPALVLLFGNTNKKHRMLDRDVIIVGRARGCDFGLEAPDISSVHCVITRGPGGFYLRDCQSRAGTKHNGKPVRETLLRDGDLLQLGPFSFRVHLPAGVVVASPTKGPTRLMHLERSRRNLARLALRLRKLWRLQRVMNQAGDGKEVEQQLSQQATALKARIRDYDRRVRTLEDAERDLINDRETLDRELAACDAKAQQAQQVLLQQQEAFERQQKEFSMTRDRWAHDQTAMLTRLGEQKSALALVEETLREQRKSLDDLVATLQEAPAATDGPVDGELQQLCADNEELRKLLAALEHEREQTALDTAEREEAASTSSRADQAAEVALLRQLLEEKDSLLEELRAQAKQPPPVERDIDSYEAELNEYRKQMESDRQKLNREIEQMRARNKELDEATREMELGMSRERAELARERQRLDRLREDVRLELERFQRDAGLRDRLAPVQNLRDEMNHRRQPSIEQPARPTNEDALNARLKALRTKVEQ